MDPDSEQTPYWETFLECAEGHHQSWEFHHVDVCSEAGLKLRERLHGIDTQYLQSAHEYEEYHPWNESQR
jgi:hypothetical protein